MSVAEVTASGVDTVSYAFRPTGSDVFDALDAFRAQPWRFGPAGALIADERGADGGRLIAFPAMSVLAIETRLGALLAADVNDHSLVPSASLVAGARNARLMMWDHAGVDPGAPTEVRRYDLASELRFGAACDGLAFLRTVAGLIPARARGTVEVGADGHVMTVYARTAKRGVVHSRIYDKGRESGSDPPGFRVRIESQNSPPKARRYSPDVLADLDLTATFGRTMKPYLHVEQLTTAGPDGAVAELAARAIRGDMSHAKAEGLIGAVALLKYGGRAVYDRDEDAAVNNNKRSSRRLKALRDAGIVLSDELPPEAAVPVSALLRDAIARFSA